MNNTRPKRVLTKEEADIVDDLYYRKNRHEPYAAFVTAATPIPMGSKDDKGPWGPNPDRVIQPGTVLKVVMVSRFGDFGLTDDLSAEFGYHVRLDYDDAAMSRIRMKP